MYWNGESSWWTWLSMTVSMVVFWGAVIWAVVAVTRSRQQPADRSPQQLLDERLARGEISVDEYQSLSRVLQEH
jgi:putative membrane protein